MTYVMAVLIYSYEVLLDAFQLQIAQLISQRASGTPSYYAQMAKYFQFNPDTQRMDELEYNDKTFSIQFKTYDETHKIIAKSAAQYYDEVGLVLKVCKLNTDSESSTGGGVYTQLTKNELTAFRNYIDEIKFVGAKIYSRSTYGDILSINATVVYDDLYINADQALQNIKAAIVSYIKSLDFNGNVYYQSVIDAIQGAEHITTITGADTSQEGKKYAKITLSEYDETSQKYKPATEVIERRCPASGYVTCIDETASERKSTLVVDSEHIILKAKSTL